MSYLHPRDEDWYCLLTKHKVTGVPLDQNWCSAFSIKYEGQAILPDRGAGDHTIVSCGAHKGDFLTEHPDMSGYIDDNYPAEYLAKGPNLPMMDHVEALAVSRTPKWKGEA